jgi:hypothetical protein
MGLLVRVVFVFEPLAPQAISYYLRRSLNEWKRHGLVSDYKTRVRRLGKYHYRIEIDMGVTGKQAVHILSDLYPSQLGSVRRWFDV